MTHLRRSPVLILALIALLAACSSADTSSATPAAFSAAPAATAAALVRGEFVGDAGDLAGIALSTNGRQVIGYLCDGTGRHVSLAQWFMGPVTGTGIDITNAHGAHLVATVTAQAITGTVTLKDGRSAPFTAPAARSWQHLRAVPQRANLPRRALPGRMDPQSAKFCQRPGRSRSLGRSLLDCRAAS
jgi:hypothetical protein